MSTLRSHRLRGTNVQPSFGRLHEALISGSASHRPHALSRQRPPCLLHGDRIPYASWGVLLRPGSLVISIRGVSLLRWRTVLAVAWMVHVSYLHILSTYLEVRGRPGTQTTPTIWIYMITLRSGSRETVLFAVVPLAGGLRRLSLCLCSRIKESFFLHLRNQCPYTHRRRGYPPAPRAPAPHCSRACSPARRIAHVCIRYTTIAATRTVGIRGGHTDIGPVSDVYISRTASWQAQDRKADRGREREPLPDRPLRARKPPCQDIRGQTRTGATISDENGVGSVERHIDVTARERESASDVRARMSGSRPRTCSGSAARPGPGPPRPRPRPRGRTRKVRCGRDRPVCCHVSGGAGREQKARSRRGAHSGRRAPLPVPGPDVRARRARRIWTAPGRGSIGR